eukprot:TRINITY_DN21814_c0_g1_i1.p1 TRINITY_DN21814_c0_g1~~TRINITY_DN21814_c0_g1_i1.p1  ORF type:complete len:361 (+),score=81.62 TRINITY_DN21814_c0_g1_i1:58-1140(+)
MALASCFPCSTGGFACCGADASCVRSASHAGSWYPEDPCELRDQLLQLLSKVPPSVPSSAAGRSPALRPPPPPVKALIVPHAGLRHCGATAAYAYAQVAWSCVERVVVLGPSHKKRIGGCALPSRSAEAYDTPFGRLQLDLDAIEELRETGDFEELALSDDEAEHSVEMQLPFTALALEAARAKADGEDVPERLLLPVLVGQLGSEAEFARYANHFADFFDDPGTLVVVSSDFCHWGKKFRYQPLLPPPPVGSPARRVSGMGSLAAAEQPVNVGIEGLDMRGIELIRDQDLHGFRHYLDQEGNTICGRHAITLLLALLALRPGRFSVDFLRYSQSRLLGVNPGPSDSSVSYAAGVCRAIA